MEVLRIIRESSGLVSARLSHLFLVTIVFIFPVSSIILSEVLVTGILAERLTQQFQEIANAARLLENALNRVLYLHLYQTLLSQALCFPVVVTLWLLAKTSVLYIINCHYQGKRASILGFLKAGPRLWTRLIVTYLWICAMVMGFASVVAVSPFVIIGFLEAFDLPQSFVPFVQMPLLIWYAVVFAQMMVIFSLAHIVSVVEERCGGAALLKALFLLKERMDTALFLFLLTTLGTAMVEYVFQCRILGRNAATSSGTCWLWEALLLVLAYSFVHLFDTITTFVLYRCCKAADWVNRETQYSLEHFSITIELVEQCKKMYSM